MTRQRCEMCGQEIRNIDFYCAIKGGCLCPSCQLAVRSVRSGEPSELGRVFDGEHAAPYSVAFAREELGPERQLFY